MSASHRNPNRHGITLLVSFIAMLAGGKAIAAETPRSAPLRVAYSTITVNQAIPWIAYEAGHFKKHGVDVELIHASSITALHALLAGEVSVAQSVTDACVSSNLGGADTVFMGAILDKPLYSFIVNPKIKSPADLKGKRVGVTRVGSTPDALARAMLKMWNLDPATDVTIVQLNEMGLLVQGLVNGVIDAAPISILHQDPREKPRLHRAIRYDQNRQGLYHRQRRYAQTLYRRATRHRETVHARFSRRHENIS